MHDQPTGTRFCLEQPWFVFNAAQEYSVHLSADPSISHFYSFQVDDREQVTLAIPDGCVDIIIDCDSDPPHARVCGSPLEFRSFNLTHRHRYFGVRFASGHVPRFAKLSPSELKGQEFDLADTINGAEELLEKIHLNQNFKERCQHFETYLNAKLPRRPAEITQKLLSVIKKCRGSLSMMKVLEDELSCTQRTIQRQFKKDTGMSPKEFGRILRYQSALVFLQTKTGSSFLDLALELGFSDQSHFQREFKTFVSTTPLDYIRRLKHEGYEGRINFI